jgi:hypothetical protein
VTKTAAPCWEKYQKPPHPAGKSIKNRRTLLGPPPQQHDIAWLFAANFALRGFL